MKESENIGEQVTIGSWKTQDIEGIYTNLEQPNWAPWLSASLDSLQGRSRVFPKGQLLVKNFSGAPLASLSTNRINWNGDKATLPSWDEVAGDPTTYEKTYKPHGNAIVMMSMNVHPEHQGDGYAKKLIDQAKLLAIGQGAGYLIGSFRPNEYGTFKLKGEGLNVSFGEYCQMVRSDGLPIDKWLRNLTRNGMQPLQIDTNAMTVNLSLRDFATLKTSFKPEVWKEVKPSLWECGEVGSWKLDTDNNVATYKESNLYGIVWKKTGLL